MSQKKSRMLGFQKKYKKEYNLLRFLIEDRGKCGIELNKYNDDRCFVASLVPLSPASEAGLKVGDILCKPGTKGGLIKQQRLVFK